MSYLTQYTESLEREIWSWCRSDQFSWLDTSATHSTGTAGQAFPEWAWFLTSTITGFRGALLKSPLFYGALRAHQNERLSNCLLLTEHGTVFLKPDGARVEVVHREVEISWDQLRSVAQVMTGYGALKSLLVPLVLVLSRTSARPGKLQAVDDGARDGSRAVWRTIIIVMVGPSPQYKISSTKLRGSSHN